jgi:sialic acid synthase SpsE
VLNRLGHGSADVVINYGFQNYPTQPAHSHLAKIQLLGLHFGRPVCFADHVSGDDPLAIELPCLAVAAGATSIEKHIIQVRDADRYDYYSSITPPQFSDMVARIRQIETCVGPQTLDLDQPEREYREKHKKCPVLRHACRAGHQLSEDDVDFKRANGQKDFTSMSEVVGRTLAVDLEGYTALRQEHLR